MLRFLPVQRQDDGSNCGAFAIAFAAEILDGKSPMSPHFDVGAMRLHLIKCLGNERVILLFRNLECLLT